MYIRESPGPFPFTMEVELPNRTECILHSTWSDLGYGKTTDLNPGVFSLKIKEAVDEKRAKIAAYVNGKFLVPIASELVIGKADTQIVRSVFPEEVPRYADSQMVIDGNISRKLFTVFLENFSTRNFSDMNDVMRNVIDVYDSYKNGSLPMRETETYQEVMSATRERNPSDFNLRRLMSTATTSKLYNISIEGLIGGDYQVFTTRVGKTLNIYLRPTQQIDWKEIMHHMSAIADAVVKKFMKLFNRPTESSITKLIQKIADYEIEDDPLIGEFIRDDAPLEYYYFACGIFAAIKDDLLAFTDSTYQEGGGDIKIYGHSLGGGLGSALACLIAFWKKMYGSVGTTRRLRAKITTLLVGQINIFSEKQSTIVNSLMIKHFGRFQLFSVSNAYDFATQRTSSFASGGGVRIVLEDNAYPAGNRSVHTMAQYIESIDRFFLRNSGISIGGTEPPYQDITTLNHIRAFSTLPSSTIARGSTQVKMARMKAIRKPFPDNSFDMAVQTVLGGQGYSTLYFRPTYFYFTDFTINPNTVKKSESRISDAAKIFIKSVVSDFQNRLIRGSLARNALRHGGGNGAMVVPVVERIYIGPGAIFSQLYLGNNTTSTWNGYKTYVDQYGGIFIRATDLSVTLSIEPLFDESAPRKNKRKEMTPKENKMVIDDSGAVPTASRTKRQKGREDYEMDV